MKILKLFFFATALLLIGCTPKTLEKATQTLVAAPSTSNEKMDTKFPEDWVGEWAGELKISKGSGVVQTLPMNMKINATDKAGEYSWLTTFGKKAETAKPYILKTVDAANGLYVIDEENSIIIESYLFENKLVSWYVVQGSLILASFEMRGPNIVFEILAGKEEAVSITGGKVIEGEVEGETIPEVKTMPFNVMQRAFLARKE